jgi:hypothetical protein
VVCTSFSFTMLCKHIARAAGRLRNVANLVLIMGNRGKIDDLTKGSRDIITQVLKLIDEYDLYGSVAYPKAHSQVCMRTAETHSVAGSLMCNRS